jgi:ribose 5-phosphate isomerase B
MPEIVIAVGSDHAGPEFKEEVIKYLKGKGLGVLDCGVPVGTQRADYPLIAQKGTDAVLRGEAKYAILICGTGIGMSMVANKKQGIRAGNCATEFAARMARSHNDCNVLTLGCRVIGLSLAMGIIDVFLSTDFEGGRHSDRLALFS